MVRRQGFEPRPRHRLRACRSTIELAAHGAVPGSRTPMFCLEGKCLPVRPVRRGGSRRNRTCLRRIRPAAKSVSARDPLSGPAESNRVSPESESGRLPSSSIPRCVAPTSDAARWRWRESNPLRRRLQGVSATSAVIPMAMRRPVQPVPGCSWALFRRIATFGRHGGLPVMVLTLLMCQQASTFTRRWCSAGTAGVEPAFRSGWSRAAYPLADP